MNPKPISVREPASRDIGEVLHRYWFDASPQVAHAFAVALRHAFQHLSQFPSTGSSHYSRDTPLSDLLAWPVQGFPYMVFYLEEASSVDIYRILHTARDIPASLREDMEE